MSTVKWWPDKKVNPNHRNWNILSRDPSPESVNIPHDEIIRPAQFEQNCADKIKKVINSVKQHYLENTNENRVIWEKWFTEYAPLDDNSTNYLALIKSKQKKGAYKIPLLLHFRKGNYGSLDSFNIQIDSCESIDYELPEIFALCMPSVETIDNPNPPEPRLYAPSNIALRQKVNNFVEVTQRYYDRENGSLFRKTVDTLTSMCRQRVDEATGNSLPVGAGTKISISSKIKASDKSFITFFYKDLLPQNVFYVQSHLFSQLSFTGEEMEVLVDYGENMTVSKKIFRQLNLGCKLEASLLKFIVNLFNQRDKRLCDIYKSINENHQGFLPRKSTKYLNDDFITSLGIPGSLENTTAAEDILPTVEAATYHKICIWTLVTDVDQNSYWALIVVNISTRLILYCDPQLPQIIPATQSEILDNLQRSFCVKISAEAWNVSMLGSSDSILFQPMTDNKYDSALYVIAMILHLDFDCPMVFIQNDLNKLRTDVAYWLLRKQIPSIPI